MVSSQHKKIVKLDSSSPDRNEHSNNKKSVWNKKLPKDKEIFQFFSGAFRKEKTWLPVWPLRGSYLSSLEKAKDDALLTWDLLEMVEKHQHVVS